ncbi:hypothetical protein LIER_36024 [Lithospermum erythrorhizon]|uniref:Uncharacterized protein n=1 Tax=Lithospermum erythrorhizon TaxID=34254 RepID=A0AAV3P0W1_LITER
MHWVAYEYDFLEKEVKVYDSMANVFYAKCQKVFGMHAAIVPSLYNIGCGEGKKNGSGRPIYRYICARATTAQ